MRRLSAIAVLTGVLALTACTSSYSGDVMEGLTSETARETTHHDMEEALAPVPDDAIRLRFDATDEDVACGASDTNPDGTIRQWRYNVTIGLNEGYLQEDLHAKIVDHLTTSGWKINFERPLGNQDEAKVVLLTPDSVGAPESEKVLSAQSNSDNSITLEANSPCFKVTE